MTYAEILTLIKSNFDRGEKSQKKLAEYLDVREATVSHWINEKREMPAYVLPKICEFLNLEITIHPASPKSEA